MKKIVLLIGFLLAVIVSYGQPTGNQQANNITIRNDAPMLHLRGEGANINFYNGDLRLTRSSNILTLTGGIFKIGTDTAATQAYARAYGGGATYPPAGIPVSTGAAWGTSITNTTVGNNFLGLTNPSAITFPRINADNTVTALSAVNFKTALSIATDIGNQIHDTIAAGIDLGTVVPLQADTTTRFVWNVGVGAAGDTACFRNSVHHDYVYGGFKWEGSDTLVVTKLIGVVNSGGDVTIQVSWDANYLDATPTNLNTSAPQITSSTAGDADTSFDNAEIPPGVWVWLTTPAVTTQPTRLSVSVIGHFRNLTY